MRELNLQDQQRLSLVGIRFASENGASEPTRMKNEYADEPRNGLWRLGVRLSPHSLRLWICAHAMCKQVLCLCSKLAQYQSRSSSKITTDE